MLYDEFQRQRPANAVVLHLGRSICCDIFGPDALIAEQVLNAHLRTISWAGQEIPVAEQSIYSLGENAARLIEAGFQVWLCRRVAGVYHYEPFEAKPPTKEPAPKRRPTPPPGYTRIKGNLEACPVCGRTDRRWFPGARIYQDDQAQAMLRKVEEDGDDWRWLSAILRSFGFAQEHIWRLMGSAPIWHDPQYRVDGQSLIAHWSRFAEGSCGCGAKFWHDWGSLASPMHYYLKIPATPNRPKEQAVAPPEPVSGQMRLFET